MTVSVHAKWKKFDSLEDGQLPIAKKYISKQFFSGFQNHAVKTNWIAAKHFAAYIFDQNIFFFRKSIMRKSCDSNSVAKWPFN